MVFDGIFTLPMVLPPTVAGFFLLMIFGVNQPIGKFFMSAFGIRIAFSFSATVIAAVVISFPLMYRNARGAFDQVDTDLVYAARTLGMSEWNIFLKVLIPNALPGIISGGVLDCEWRFIIWIHTHSTCTKYNIYPLCQCFIDFFCHHFIVIITNRMIHHFTTKLS